MIFIFLFLLNPSVAQNPVKYLYLDDPVYLYMDYLINAGKLTPDFVFHQPYKFDSHSIHPIITPVGGCDHWRKIETQKATKDSLENQIHDYFLTYWQNYYTDQSVGAQIDLSDRVNYNDDIYNRYKITWGLHLATENITLANRTMVDQNYKYDTHFAGDLSESEHWLYGRVNDAYINLRYNRFNLFFGRMHRNWGPVNSHSLILSNNPYTYDHFLFSYTWDKIKLSLIFAQLENVNAVLTNVSDTTTQQFPNSRKYMVGHRIDINLYDNFQIAFTEMATYGGPDRDIELAFFNPMNFYYALQRNDNQAISGIWNVDIFYKPIPKLTLYGQFLLDDVIVNNDPGVDDRARFPDRLGVMTSIRSGDLFFQGLNSEFTYVRIWNRTYQSKVTYENFHYRKLGLGYPCASCEEVKLKFGVWSFFPLFIQNETIVGRYGNVLLTDPFPFIKESFPVKPVINNLVNITSLKYFYNSSFTFFSNVFYFDDKNHYLNKGIDNSEFRIEVGASMLLSTGITDL
ncbi:capsule assembly Wzi family protein [Calditrichota bacterium]